MSRGAWRAGGGNRAAPFAAGAARLAPPRFSARGEYSERGHRFHRFGHSDERDGVKRKVAAAPLGRLDLDMMGRGGRQCDAGGEEAIEAASMGAGRRGLNPRRPVRPPTLHPPAHQHRCDRQQRAVESDEQRARRHAARAVGAARGRWGGGRRCAPKVGAGHRRLWQGAGGRKGGHRRL